MKYLLVIFLFLARIAGAQAIQTAEGLAVFTDNSTNGPDGDLIAYWSRACLSSGPSLGATSNLLESLKGNGLWTQWNAIYPFATTNVPSCDAANLTSSGGTISWTNFCNTAAAHTAAGVGNDSTGYGNTGFGLLTPNVTVAVYASGLTRSNSYILGQTHANDDLGDGLHGIRLSSTNAFFNIGGNDYNLSATPLCVLPFANETLNKVFLAISRQDSNTMLYALWTPYTNCFGIISNTIITYNYTNLTTAFLISGESLNELGFNHAFAGVEIGFAAVGNGISLTTNQLFALSGIVTNYENAMGR